MHDSTSEENLRKLLIDHGVDCSTWSETQGSHSIEDLVREIERGECLVRRRAIRYMQGVVLMTIKKEGLVLIEVGDERPSTGRRPLNRYPGEKMRPGEDYQDTVKRGIKEELGIAPERIRILTETHKTSERICCSSSYPGLITIYPLNHVDVQVNGLPDADFTTEEQNELESITHYWSWRSKETMEK